MRALSLVVLLGGCGFTVAGGQSTGDDAGADPMPDAAVDAPPDAPTITCAASYTDDFGGSRYRVATGATKRGYDAAALGCTMDGGRLAVIESLAEHDHIASLVHNFSDWSWIGLTDRVTEGTRVWITGRPLMTTDFQVFNPEVGDANADCYNLSPQPIGSDSARWGNYDCAAAKGWICECDYTP